MIGEEIARLKLALKALSKIDKVKELSESEFRLLGFDKEYKNNRNEMEFYPPTFYMTRNDIREHCVDIVVEHIANKETEFA